MVAKKISLKHLIERIVDAEKPAAISVEDAINDTQALELINKKNMTLF